MGVFEQIPPAEIVSDDEGLPTIPPTVSVIAVLRFLVPSPILMIGFSRLMLAFFEKHVVAMIEMNRLSQFPLHFTLAENKMITK